VGDDPDTLRETFDEAHSEMMAIRNDFEGEARRWAKKCWTKHNLKNANRTFSNVDESGIIKSTKELEDEWTKYAREAYKHQKRYVKARNKLKETEYPDWNYDNESTPWDSDYTGATTPYNIIKAEIADEWGIDNWKDTKAWVKKALDSSELREWDTMMQRSNKYVSKF